MCCELTGTVDGLENLCMLQIDAGFERDISAQASNY